MTASIDPSLVGTELAQSYLDQIKAETESVGRQQQTAHDRYRDSLSLSAEARHRHDVEQARKEAAEPATWESLLGVADGTSMLKNGHRQVVDIDGAAITIEEYDGDRLIKSTQGRLDSGSMVLDTEIYDKSGAVEQTLHTEIVNADQETMEHWTAAKVSRSIQWFDNGELTRRMRDSMILQSHSTANRDPENFARYLQGITDSDVDPNSLAALTGLVTDDTNKTDYEATIEEFAGGHLAREVVIEQNATFSNTTNRSDSKFNGMDPKTTAQTAHTMNMAIRITDFDADGELLRQASFEDYHSDNIFDEHGQNKQSVSVSWYDDGEIVKKSRGDLSLSETEHSGLAKRPDLLQTLGIEPEDYATDTPQTAMELMAGTGLDLSDSPDQFGAALRSFAASGRYNPAESIADHGAGDQPYSITWSDEYYAEGKLAARREDSESAIENPFGQELSFRTAGGLTEDERPATLRRTSHMDESYDNGRVRNRAEVASREFIERDEHGPDRINTFTVGQQDTGAADKTVHNTSAARLGDVDAQANTASSSMEQEVGLIMGDVYSIFRSLNSDATGISHHDGKVHFTR